MPEDVKSRADSAYELWQINPHAHGLYFKRVGKKRPVYSVRIGSGYRALGVLQGDAVIWFWIGTHDEYEGILKHLQPPDHESARSTQAVGRLAKRNPPNE